MKDVIKIIFMFIIFLLIFEIKDLREKNTMLKAQRIFDYVNGKIEIPDDELKEYDLNKDGVVDKLDSLKLLRKYYGYE